MTITAALCNDYKVACHDGIHQPGDVYKIALYLNTANIDKSTAAYTASGEASGTGYTAGGMALTGRATGLSGDTGYLTFADPTFTAVTLSNVRGALIYNATRANRTVAVLDFGADLSPVNADLQIDLVNAAPGQIRFT